MTSRQRAIYLTPYNTAIKVLEKLLDELSNDTDKIVKTTLDTLDREISATTHGDVVHMVKAELKRIAETVKNQKISKGIR